MRTSTVPMEVVVTEEGRELRFRPTLGQQLQNWLVWLTFGAGALSLLSLLWPFGLEKPVRVVLTVVVGAVLIWFTAFIVQVGRPLRVLRREDSSWQWGTTSFPCGCLPTCQPDGSLKVSETTLIPPNRQPLLISNFILTGHPEGVLPPDKAPRGFEPWSRANAGPSNRVGAA